MIMLQLGQLFINKIMRALPQGSSSSILFMEPAGLGKHYGARR